MENTKKVLAKFKQRKVVQDQMENKVKETGSKKEISNSILSKVIFHLSLFVCAMKRKFMYAFNRYSYHQEFCEQ